MPSQCPCAKPHYFKLLLFNQKLYSINKQKIKSTFFSFCKDHKVIVLGLTTSGILVSVGLLYYNKDDQEYQDSLNTSNNMYESVNKNTQKQNIFDLERVDMLQYSIEVAGDEYLRITLANRKQRRIYK
ncbi:unnamed protein product [Paramecium sonneborni]|uniref:Transmembrane protein n=1 Tax=Paramecium sonneborni TaxID=65129 RepID=A0A8S1RPQ0_9CILI|nr:unnamed protein product [Paramecium sonneborni]